MGEADPAERDEAMTAKDDSLRSPESPPCVACGQRHGSVGVQIACLGQAILVLRAKLEEKQR